MRKTSNPVSRNSPQFLHHRLSNSARLVSLQQMARALAITAVVSQAVYAGDRVTSTRDTVTLIVDTFKSRQSDLNPVYVRYHTRKFKSGAYGAAATGRDEALEDLVYEGHSILARKGRLFHSSYTGPVIADWAIVETKRRGLMIYDGTHTVHSGAFRGQSGNAVFHVSQNPPPAGESYATPWKNACEKFMSRNLQLWLNDEASGTVALTNSALDDGTTVLKLTLINAANWSFDATFLPDVGYGINHVEARDDQQNVMMQCSADYELLDGIPVPTYSLKRGYMDGELSDETEITVEEITTDPSKIPAELFQFEIPEEAEVYDEDLQRTIRNAALAQAPLDEIQRRQSTGRIYYILFLNLVMLALLAAFVVWRIRRRPVR